MSEKRAIPPVAHGNGKVGAAAHLVLASSIMDLEQGRVVVLLATQPDPRRPAQFQLDATVVPERPLGQAVRLVVRWRGGHRSARVNGAGCARLRGIPASAVQALQGGDQQALLLQVEKAVHEDDAVG